MNNIDDQNRADEIRDRIKGKKSLFKLYTEYYTRYASCLRRCPADGVALEIGSGAGFLKDVVPNAITTDIIPYNTVDIAIDATRLPFTDCSIRSIFMLNALHHIPKAENLFIEFVRCLKPGGRILIIDQYCGLISKWIYKFLHHEPFDPKAANWDFETKGPLSGANGALCWIIFYRDRELFNKLFPSLRIVNSTPHTPLRYWLTGGLKWWHLLPGFSFNFSTMVDSWLSQQIPELSSFVEIELVKIA